MARLGFLVLVVLAGGLAAQERRTVDKTPTKPPPGLTRQEALEQFRKLRPEERLQRVQKVAKEGEAFVPVTRGDLEVTITERGQLEAADAFDIICRVKAKSSGSTVATTVRSVIEDGTQVKVGDTLVTLDDSALQEQLRTQTIIVDKATANKVAAEETLKIARIQNELDLRTAEITLKEAFLALKKYAGKDADEKELLGLKVEQAKLSLEVAKLQARVKEVTAAAAAKERAALAAQEEGRKRDLTAELRACVIKAPRAGVVIYYIPEQARWGVGRQSIVAQGEPVSEGQKLMQIWDLKRSVVNTKVHEALISRVRVGQLVAVRVDAFYDRPLRGRVKAVANVASSADFLSGDVKVFAVQIALTQAIPDLRPGANAEVRIIVAERQKVLRMPLESVLRSGREAFCYVKVEKGVEERLVRIGARSDFLVEVKEGLKEGELVLRDPRAVASLSARPPAKGILELRIQPRWPEATQVLVRSVHTPPSAADARTRVQTYGLTYKDLERIAALPNVAEVVPVRRFKARVSRLDRVHPLAEIVATVPACKDFVGLRLAAGRFLNEEDDLRMKNVVVLGADVAERLFPETDPLGKAVRIDRFFYEVVGVLREQRSPTGALNNGMFVPLRTCNVRFGKRVILRQAGSWTAEAVPLHEIWLAARAPEQVPLLVESITTFLEEAHPKKDWAVRSAATSSQR